MKENVPIEIANELVKLMKNQKKIFPETMVEQMLSMYKESNLMSVTQKPIEQEANSKSDGTPMCTSDSKSAGTLMGTPMCTPMGTLVYEAPGTLMGTPMCTLKIKTSSKSEGTPVSKSVGTPMCTPMITTSSNSEGTPIGTPCGTPVYKSVGTPMDRPISTPNSKLYCTVIRLLTT